MKSVNINDVAAELGLSRNTVSKVLNNKDGVGEKTRKKIIQAALRLGYPKLASALLIEIDQVAESNRDVKNRGNVVIIANRRALNSFWGIIMTGICTSLASDLFSPVYCLIEDDESSVNSISQIPIVHSPAGIIVANIYDRAIVKAVAELELPTVYYDCPVSADSKSLNGDIVLVEGVTSVKAIVKELLLKGCVDAIFVGDITYSRTIYDRFVGFGAGFDELSIKYDKSKSFLIDSEKYYTKESIEQVMRELKARGLPSAIVCGNDLIARLIIIWLVENGYSVPEDVRVSGFDDSPECEIMKPTITSVKLYTELIGNRLARQLISRMLSPSDLYETIIMSAAVKFRQSTM